MYWSLVLDSLAKAAREGDEHAALAALDAADPVVRSWLRRRVRRRIAWASRCVADPSDRAHVLKLAFLREADLDDDVELENRGAVRAAFDAAATKVRVRRGDRYWFASLLIAFTISLSGAALFWLTRPVPPGFTPLETRLGRAFGVELTAFDSALFQLRRLSDDEKALGDLAGARERLLTGVEQQLGPGGGLAVEDLLRNYQNDLLPPPGEIPDGEATRAALLTVNAALRAARQPYLLDFIWDPESGAILTSQYIAREQDARAEGATIRLLRVQRLDHINRQLAFLGYTRPELGAALVALDMLEREVVSVIAPALADKGRARFVDLDSEDVESEWAKPVEDRAGQVLRRDYESFRTRDLDRVIDSLSRRDRLFWQFRSAIPLDRLPLDRPTTLVVHDDLSALEGHVLDSELREFRAINDELASEPMRRAFDELLDRFAQRIERHEIEHQIDFRRGLVVVPAELRALLGMPETMDVAPFSNAARCRDELSADLASIAASEEHAAASLVQVVEPVFDRTTWATPHAFGAAVILAAIAAELGVPEPAALYGGRQFDRRRATRLLAGITERPPLLVASAAHRVYARLFGNAVATVQWGTWRVAPVWRK